MTGSAFLPIGSYMLDMPIEGSYRYCRITGHRRRGEIWRSWGLPPESHFPEYADATGIPPTAAERVGCMIIQGRVRWPNTSNLLMRAGGLPPRKGPTGPLGAKPTASRSFVRVRGSGPLQCDTGERERSP
jgi:hypothetical protein